MKTNCMEPDAVVSNVVHLLHDVTTIHNKWLTSYAQIVELFHPESNMCAISNRTIVLYGIQNFFWKFLLSITQLSHWFIRQSVELDSQNLLFNQAQ